MTRTIDLSPNLGLALDYVTKTVGIIAQRRTGKTYTANVIAEELHRLGLPWVALDPTGAWWGLRSSADGKRPGIPVVIIGGEHGDVPLERTGGKLVADLVVEQPGWYVLDLSLLESKEAERQFATDFAERLYRRKGQPGGDGVLHLFIDEADLFAPQDSPKGDKRMLGAFESLVRRGGLRGLGTTLITQRAAVINKNVLEQIEMLIALRTIGPNDQKAIRAYVAANGTPTEVADLMGSLASLGLGEAWVWEPGAEPSIFERVQVRQRRTFNSSATPKAGEQRIEPARFASVDLDTLKERMEATIKRAEQDDPVALRRQIKDLDRQLAAAQSVRDTVEQVVEIVEVPVLTKEALDHATAIADQIDHILTDLGPLHTEVTEFLANARRATLDTLNRASAQATSAAQAGRSVEPVRRERPVVARPAPASSTGEGSLSAADRLFLGVLKDYPDGRTLSQLCVLAGRSKKSSAVSATLAGLRRDGYIGPGSPITLTPEGFAVIGADPDAAAALTGPDLVEHWAAKLNPTEAAMLRAFAAVGGFVDLAGLCAAVDRSPTSSASSAAVANLRSLGLVNGWTAAPELRS